MFEQVTLTLDTPHGPLNGELFITPETRGVVLLPHGVNGSHHPEEELALHTARDQLLAAGLGCMTLCLVTEREDHYADSLSNVSLLTQRLTQGLESLKMDTDPTRHRLGLLAWGALTPVAVRVAAVHDRDFEALACFGGLLDLAGLQYLRSLATPLLFVQPTHDAPSQHSNERAWRYIDCPKDMQGTSATADLAHNPMALSHAMEFAISHFLCLLL